MIPELSLGVCRCHDKACPMAQSCLRFLRRDDKGWQLVSVATWRDPETGRCENRIPYDEKRTEYVKQ